MGFVGSLFGGSYKPERAKTIESATGEQAKQLYGQTQEGLAQQQAFLNALSQQGGVANQANVFRQLQDVASGVGPNPALAALQQATGQNIAAQNALMAGQRGGGRNVGLLARQIGQQGGALQQQAAGQGATMQAQQQLAALGQLGGISGQQVAQQQTGLEALNRFGLTGQQNILNALTQQNQQKIEEQNAINKANAERAKAGSNFLGSLIGTAGSLAMMPMTGGLSAAGALSPAPEFGSYKFGQYSFAKGGEVKKPQYADGGLAGMQPQSYIGQYFQNPNQMLGAINQSDNLRDSQLDYSTLNDGGAVNRDGMYAKGGMAPMSLMKQGGHVPGKAAVAGDSYKNDIVDAKLSPGEIVIPRSIVNHPNAPEMAAKFVRDTLSKKKGYADGGEVVENYEEPEVIAYDNSENLEPEIKTLQDPEETSLVKDNVPFDVSYNNTKGTQITPEMLKERNIASVTPKTPTVKTEQPSLFEKGFYDQRKAYLETGRLADEQAKLEEAEYDKIALDLEQKQENYKTELNDVNSEMNNLRMDIMQNKIDPRRFISNMSTGNKIGTAIGLILGGIGAGLTGGENVVLKQLNNYIEQDLYAQKAELGKKESLLSALNQKYGNTNQAMQMARIMMTDSLSLQMKRIASQYAGKIEAQRLNAEIGKLDQSVADQVDTFAKSRMYTSGKEISAELDPYREQRVSLGSGETLYGASEEISKEKQVVLDNIKKARATLTQMEEIRKLKGSAKLPTPSKAKMRDLEGDLKLPLYSIFIGPNYTERNAPAIKDKIPDPTILSDDVFNYKILNLYKELDEKEKEIKRNLYKVPVKNSSRNKYKPSNALNMKNIEQDISEGI